MNVELLTKVRDAILEEPRRIDMQTWAKAVDDVPCGTVGCIYGWGQALLTNLRGKRLEEVVGSSIRYEGLYNLPIDNPFGLTEEQAKCLYFTDTWPAEFSNRLEFEVDQTPEYARIVADRIDHFIATEGRE